MVTGHSSLVKFGKTQEKKERASGRTKMMQHLFKILLSFFFISWTRQCLSSPCALTSMGRGGRELDFKKIFSTFSFFSSANLNEAKLFSNCQLTNEGQLIITKQHSWGEITREQNTSSARHRQHVAFPSLPPPLSKTVAGILVESKLVCINPLQGKA